MITETFIVNNYERLVELQMYIKENMSTCRFSSNPFKLSSGKYMVSLSYDSQDINKLNKYHNKFYEIDNPPKVKEQSLIKKIIKKYLTDIFF